MIRSCITHELKKPFQMTDAWAAEAQTARAATADFNILTNTGKVAGGSVTNTPPNADLYRASMLGTMTGTILGQSTVRWPGDEGEAPARAIGEPSVVLGVTRARRR
jgi:hypothetical protein